MRSQKKRMATRMEIVQSPLQEGQSCECPKVLITRMERGLVCTLNAAALIGVEQTTPMLSHRCQSGGAGTCSLVCSAGGGLRTETSFWADLSLFRR